MHFIESTAWASPSQFRGDIGAMIIDADPVVKLVLLVLIIFSVVSWGIVVYKWVLFHRSIKRDDAILESFSKHSLADIAKVTTEFKDAPLSKLFNEAYAELSQITDKATSIPLAILNNVENRLEDARMRYGMELFNGLGFLASISNASPFIGLFGTVWGIMDAFRKIGLMGSANLATVAPGISEALIATAAGLFVAIPAVLFYNYFVGFHDRINSQMETFQTDFMNLIRRGVIHADK